MSVPNSEERLDVAAIKQRAEEATPEPWEQHSVARRLVLRPGDATCGRKPQAVASTVRGEDAEFIAHAREDIRALLAERERLREALEKARDDFREIERLGEGGHGCEHPIAGRSREFAMAMAANQAFLETHRALAASSGEATDE